jgi:branched-chain amino acid aminotransferase
VAQWEAIDRGYDSAILATHGGIITEGVGFNVGIITENKIIAPKSNRLEGTVMNLVKDLCIDNNKMFEYKDFYKGDILHADAMFLTSTAGNVIVVTKFENKIFEKNETLTWLMDNI